MGRFMALVKFLIISFVVIVILLKVGDKLNINLKDQFALGSDDAYTSPYIYVIERENGHILYEKNAQSKAYPASLTKIMTAIVALEHIDDLSSVAPVDLESYREMVARNASMAGFFGNEQVTYRDLLYGTILSSGGEATSSLAINVAGSLEQFVQMMNDKATELGMNHTNFTNPEGLHDKNQYTTAADMAKLLNFAVDNGHFKAIFTKEFFQTTSTADHPEGVLLKSTVLTSLNKEEKSSSGIIGGKSGTTYEAGQNWATLGLFNNREYISIVMGAPLDDISNPDKAQIEDTLNIYKMIQSKE